MAKGQKGTYGSTQKSEANKYQVSGRQNDGAEGSKIFLNVYDAEWKLDNGLRRIIRNENMLLLKEDNPVKRYEIRGGNVVILTPPAVGSPIQG